ncbi:conjugal transfer mating pair stabilization protein TraG [Escherichia coli]|uniref:Conjugal transfer mating pair stabilization protein TraG n=1 Tax=Escherichia coli TaxID=562 RepID=A0A484VHD1_ECOLX|nr:conjugal transfer mating pair stabilization protein TraG [Escherichia coli]
MYSHFASSAISPTASAAGSVVDGNYSYGNMQTENVNGFSWSTNSTTSFGQMMYQTGSGATATQTRDGNMVMDASGAMSRLPVGINATRQIAAAQQEMARGGVEQSRKRPAWVQQQYCQCLELAQSVWF